MTNKKLIMAPNWAQTLDQFEVNEVRQFQVQSNEMAKARAVIVRMKKKSPKVFVTNSLLSGGFEIKRTK